MLTAFRMDKKLVMFDDIKDGGGTKFKVMKLVDTLRN